jgi:hypothetical protein
MVCHQWLDGDIAMQHSLFKLFVAISFLAAEANAAITPLMAQSAKDASAEEALAALKKDIDQRAADLATKKAQYNALLKQANVKPSKSAEPDDAVKKPAHPWQGMFERYQKQYVREGHYGWETSQKISPSQIDPCNPQQLYIRADSLDNYLYGITPSSKAVGASVSYTDDHVARTQTVAINGMVSYVALRDLCPQTPAGDAPFISGYAVAPFVQGQGSLTTPQSKKEQSTAKIGVEAQVEVARGFPLRQVFTVAPYYLTDYRGLARAEGTNLYWDAYDSDLHLGGYLNTDPNLGWFVQLRGEGDIRNVDAVGVTNLQKREYAWLGGTVRASFFLFPTSMNVPPELRNRLSFIGEMDWFDDAKSNSTIWKYVATAKYNITDAGNSSLQLQYTRGTDKDTMVFLNQLMLKLSYAY